MKITLITACYNSASVIRTAMESVLRQTWPETEYLVIDGGSTDGTVDLIREFEPKFGGRMRWMSEPDKGLYDALNKGIRMAAGEVVGILNADDVLADDGVIERVASAFGECGNAVMPDCVNAGYRDGDASEKKAIRHSGNKAVIPPQCPDAVYGDIRFVSNRTYGGWMLCELKRRSVTTPQSIFGRVLLGSGICLHIRPFIAGGNCSRNTDVIGRIIRSPRIMRC